MFRGKIFLCTYDQTNLSGPKPRENLHLNTANKVTDLLLHSGRTPKLSVSSKQPMQHVVGVTLVLTDEGLATSLCALAYHLYMRLGF